MMERWTVPYFVCVQATPFAVQSDVATALEFSP
jgi:hypothetical protein